MRSATLKYATVFALLASGALLAGCSDDARGDGGAQPASLTVATDPPPSTDLPVAIPVPVDAATAKTAWKEGVALFDAGDYEQASVRMKTAVAGPGHDPYRNYLLGLALWKSGDREAAEASLVESAKLDPTRLKTWINLARVRHDRGDRTGALEASQKALDLDPESADALHQKGRALMELGRGEEALTTLSSARELAPGNGYVANTLGLLLIQLGKPADAVPALEAAKVALPHVGYVRNNLAVAYERTGRLDEAKLEYLAAVDAGDAGGKAMKSLARLGATDTTEAPVNTASAETH